MDSAKEHVRLARQAEELARQNLLLREALRDDPSKWSFWALVEVARLVLDRDYPADVFTGASGDAGSAFVARLREALDMLPERAAPPRHLASREEDS